MSQRELYRNLMDALYDSILLVDEKGHVVDCNMRVEHTFGYSMNEMWDMPLQQLIKGFGPIVLARLAEPLSEGRPVIISGRGIRKGGALFEAEVTASKVKLLRNDSLLFAVRDITSRLRAVQEKARAQAQAQQAQAQQTQAQTQAQPAAPVRVIRCAAKAAAS